MGTTVLAGCQRPAYSCHGRYTLKRQMGAVFAHAWWTQGLTYTLEVHPRKRMKRMEMEMMEKLAVNMLTDSCTCKSGSYRYVVQTQGMGDLAGGYDWHETELHCQMNGLTVYCSNCRSQQMERSGSWLLHRFINGGLKGKESVLSFYGIAALEPPSSEKIMHAA